MAGVCVCFRVVCHVGKGNKRKSKKDDEVAKETVEILIEAHTVPSG